MATKNSQTTKMILKVVTGTDASGKAVYAQRNFAHIDPAITDDDFLSIGTKLAALQASPLEGVYRQDQAGLKA